MNSELEQQLKHDGQTIKQQAQSRLDQWDVSASVIQTIVDDNKTPKAWWYGLAAAIGLTVMIWAFNSTDSVQPIQAHPGQTQQAASQSIQLNFKQLPQSLEQKINQPLLDEQQAILEDLEMLKAQLLSI